jgi:predicted MPP superfamily phosphohydrolase
MAVTLVSTLAGYVAPGARHRAPYQPRLEHVDLDGRLASRGMPPIRVGFVTDTHVGPVIRARDVDRALALLFASPPDLLLLGGDFICESPRYIPEAARVLGDYASSPRYGTLAVLGNHDYSNDAPRLVRALERRGVSVLRNEATAIAHGGEPLWVAGIDDALLGRPDPDAAFASVPEKNSAIALWHEPDWAERLARFAPIIQLSGHSHGGQVRLPVLGAVATPSGGRAFPGGLHEAGDARVYTSRGVGVYRPPVRFRCSPEVTLVTIR